MDIVVDVREPKELKQMIERKFSTVKYERLEYGDIEINGHICIERKTPSDFVSSIKDGRIFRQAHGMKKNYDVAVIMVTGTMGSLFVRYNARGMNENAIMGAVASLTSKGIIVLFVGNHMLWYLDRLIQHEMKERKPRRQIKKSSGDVRIDVLTSFPMIGEAKAKQILERYGHVMNALENVEDWVSIKGIGHKIVLRALDILYTPLKEK